MPKLKKHEGHYSDNYLKYPCMIYKPYYQHLRKLDKGTYVMTKEYQKEIITTAGDSAWILFEYYYSKYSFKHFKPTDNKKIGEAIGWKASKVARVRTLLVKHRYMLFIKDTVKGGSILYRVLMGKELVTHFIEHGTLPKKTKNIKETISTISEDSDIDPMQ
jgi:hypothetical protein